MHNKWVTADQLKLAVETETNSFEEISKKQYKEITGQEFKTQAEALCYFYCLKYLKISFTVYAFKKCEISSFLHLDIDTHLPIDTLFVKFIKGFYTDADTTINKSINRLYYRCLFYLFNPFCYFQSCRF
ncbi:hypothetical protein ABFY60_13085 [Lysinibacillus pakistanensis]|uniref:hypothetical protein n=1 Tax=Lysinibacillus pakistanensis TaxID=759811 RepID=UPI003D2E78F9